ncbi:MAG TPA: hypothetical protein VLD57_06560 [Blastocatellia bacterium]|nr:hypothetical protein [Blastocatellia bacterium]
MRNLKSHAFTLASAAIAVTMVALFSINSIAASAQAFTGRLAQTKGRVTINFMPAAEGATFSSGSTIITEGDGEATLEFGDLGRMVVRPNSNIKVNMTPSNIEVIMQYCSSITQTVPPEVNSQIIPAGPTTMEIAVSRGEVIVDRDDNDDKKRGKVKIKADKDKDKYEVRDKVVGVSKNVRVIGGDTTYTMNCCSCCFVEKRRP